MRCVYGRQQQSCKSSGMSLSISHIPVGPDEDEQLQKSCPAPLAPGHPYPVFPPPANLATFDPMLLVALPWTFDRRCLLQYWRARRERPKAIQLNAWQYLCSA